MTPEDRKLIEDHLKQMIEGCKGSTAEILKLTCMDFMEEISKNPIYDGNWCNMIATLLGTIQARYANNLKRMKIVFPETEEEVEFYKTMHMGFHTPEKPGRET